MTTDSYRKALQAARADKESLLTERAKIDKKLTQVDQIIDSLLPLCDDEAEVQVMQFQVDLSELGLADACRAMLQKSGRFVTPVVLRNSLLKEGYDLSEHTNPLASIHSILARLSESGEAEKTDIDGKAFYRWKAAVPTDEPIRFPRPTRRQIREANEAEQADPQLTPAIDITSESRKKLIRDALKTPARPLEMKTKQRRVSTKPWPFKKDEK